jgi:hypothetical protein
LTRSPSNHVADWPFAVGTEPDAGETPALPGRLFMSDSPSNPYTPRTSAATSTVQAIWSFLVRTANVHTDRGYITPRLDWLLGSVAVPSKTTIATEASLSAYTGANTILTDLVRRALRLSCASLATRAELLAIESGALALNVNLSHSGKGGQGILALLPVMLGDEQAFLHATEQGLALAAFVPASENPDEEYSFAALLTRLHANVGSDPAPPWQKIAEKVGNYNRVGFFAASSLYTVGKTALDVLQTSVDWLSEQPADAEEFRDLLTAATAQLDAVAAVLGASPERGVTSGMLAQALRQIGSADLAALYESWPQ